MPHADHDSIDLSEKDIRQQLEVENRLSGASEVVGGRPRGRSMRQSSPQPHLALLVGGFSSPGLVD